jgi:hypothetical protein
MSRRTSGRSKTNIDQDKLSILILPKRVDWEAVKRILLGETAEDGSTTTIVAPHKNVLSDSLCHQTLTKACLDPTVCPETLQLLLDRPTFVNLVILDKIKLGMKAARCDNPIACRALVQADPSILSWKNARADTLLHLACAENGWNSAIACLLDATMERFEHMRGYGLFQLNVRDQCPLWLSLEGGGDVADILDHMKHHHPLYLKTHVELLTQIMAEYCTDMTALEELVQEDPSFLEGADDTQHNAPLYYACYYQNPNMIRFVLQYYQGRGDKRKKLLKRLMTKNTTNARTKQRSDSSFGAETKTKAPFTWLVLGVGRSDPGNSIECIQACRDILGDIPVLHYAIDEALWPENTDTDSQHSPPTTTKQCLQTVRRIMDHWQVDMLSLDDKKRTVVSLLVLKQPVSASNTLIEESIQVVLKYILSQCPELAFVRDKRKRLPLHLACEAGWRWTKNETENLDANSLQSSNASEQHPEILEQLVQANPSALEIMDPKLRVFPFALATDLPTIYNLLRYQPGVLR